MFIIYTILYYVTVLKMKKKEFVFILVNEIVIVVVVVSAFVSVVQSAVWRRGVLDTVDTRLSHAVRSEHEQGEHEQCPNEQHGPVSAHHGSVCGGAERSIGVGGVKALYVIAVARLRVPEHLQ